MQHLTKTIALCILGTSLGSLDLLVWFFLRLPFGVEAMSLEVNHALVSWHILVRGIITAILAWTFLYFRAHCVIANREESTRIVTKG